MNEQTEDRLLDLLCKQVSEGLTSDEQRELSGLERTVESKVDLNSLEMTAAAIAVSGFRADDPMPDRLKAGILARADEHFSGHPKAGVRDVRLAIESENTSMPVWGWLGWAAAALASIALAFNVYQNSDRTDERAGVRSPSPTPEVLSPSQSRDRLISSVPDVVKADWGGGNVAGLELVGDIVWSDAMQQGYMRFQNLPKNDTAQYTYQLWIFDETQDEKTPIDGGVFDVTADGEIVVPIDAKLKARGPKAFALTMEKPGGVMVSKRDRVVALAPVKRNLA